MSPFFQGFWRVIWRSLRLFASWREPASRKGSEIPSRKDA